jgi:sn-glycerol 3-phosphate transport system substrate-binding protein
MIVAALVGCSSAPSRVKETSTSAAPIVTEPVVVSSPTTEAPPSSTKTSASSSAPQLTSAPTSLEPPPAAPSTSAAPSRCEAPGDEHTINLWHIFAGTQANLTFDALVDQFNMAHPLTHLVSTKFAGFSALRQELDATPLDEWPDIVVNSSASLTWLVDTGLIVPPAECQDGDDAKDLLPVIRATYTIDGQLQAEPYGVSTPLLLFDAAEAARAGLDPSDPPSTLDELRAASKKVVDSGVSPHGLVVSDVVGEFLVYQGAAQRGELVSSANNGRSAAIPSVDLATPANVEALSWMVDVVNNAGGVWIGSAAGSEDLIKVIDLDDGGVFALHTSASIGDILVAIDAGSFNGVELGVAPMPGPGPGGTVGGNAMFLIDHHSPTRAGAAWQVVDWLTQPRQMATFDVATGYIPPGPDVRSTPEVVDAYAKHPQLQVGFDQLDATAGTDAAAGPSFGPEPEVDAVFADLTAKVVLGQETPTGGLEKASAAINDLLQAYASLNNEGDS